MHNQTDAAKIVRGAVHVYKVAFDTITAKIKREFATKEKGKAVKRVVPKSASKPPKKTDA